ncbi:hypothetical protein FGE12_12040 [Aggregicoccus sp. 17bor-14]|uniref:hypothetical protein n=1 Tax=Myxococcaceae TaxID=31 RepID=UPI00129C81B1|nr:MULTISPECIES: hypothetical protein [Myxococcaceae]MBF5043119.1 hypothetical protein [Simulacricoccus sp. 17bor-14]MRI88881.1 hypothetical protein [Aggregicoccus sp. 17bor-14]
MPARRAHGPLLPAALALLLALLPRALAQAPAKPPPPPRACPLETWSCIAGCIEGKCLERCMAPCAGAMKGLRSCLRKAQCAASDTACWRKACPEACGRVFASVKGAPGAEAPGQCAPQPGAAFALPEEWTGQWELTGAGFVRQSKGTDDQSIRSDYGLLMRIAAPGCFEMETRLGGPTLGSGNALTMRIWGQVVMLDKDEWEARALGGSLEGVLCGEPRDVALPDWSGRNVTRLRCEVEGGVLLLTPQRWDKRQFSFERKGP